VTADPGHHEPPGDLETDGHRRRRFGRVLQAIAVFGAVAAVVITASLWRFVGDLDRNLEQSLVIGEDASTTLIETLDVADEVVDSVDAGLVSLGATLRTIEQLIGDSGGVAASTASLAAALPESFDDVDAALATVESLSGAIDAALRGASRIPLGPDYDPAVPLPDAVGNLRDAFEPIGAELDEIAVELDAFAEGSVDLADEVTGVGDELERTRLALSDSRALLDQYRVSARDARDLAISSRTDLDRSLTWARVAAVLIGLVIASAQVVPWWLGARLRRADDRPVG
jgi:hypothetical protein